MAGVLLLPGLAATALAQQKTPAGWEKRAGLPIRMEQLPAGRLRSQMESLPKAARERSLQWLQSFHFCKDDVRSLRSDPNGGIYYVCETDPIPDESEPPQVAAAALPVSPFPASLIFHSKPGAANVLFIEFSGTNISGTEWNTSLGRTNIPTLPFSTDSDYTTFSDSEQASIKRIWQRMAEDFAPFDIDITTERPAAFNNRTAVALITRNTDADGAANPSSSAGGVAYVNVFNSLQYSKYRPAWIYHNNLGNSEANIAEAASHEIGHNLGLSHDGKTDGADYYGGHGSGDISWGPLMGTGYGRNVSQWCKGDYYLANNTQDDLSVISGKISYRTDDHGNTPASATALVITGGTNIVSTTPENDPSNLNTANKGILERNTDVDVFSFITGSGAVRLAVSPWVQPSGTRGGNSDILMELYNEAGALLATNNPASQTTALIQTNLVEGLYFLHVRNTGTGDPYSSSPSGYTAYASIGRYFINGYLTESTGFVVSPQSDLQATNLTQSGQAAWTFTVTYSDNVAVNVASIDSGDVRVTGPNGYDQLAQFVSLDVAVNGTPRIATYAVTPPGGGTWSPMHNGTYSFFMRSNQVSDTEGAFVAASQLGQFQVSIPVTIYAANMDVPPGWTLEPDWQYGVPTYASGAPSGGFTGTKIIGYNLAGNYPNNLGVKYATTPAVNCSGTSALTLRFMRWLRTRQNDTASIQVSTNGLNWINVWSTTAAISDAGWQSVQYTLPAGIAGNATVQLRWALASNASQNDIGWNIDDVELLGDGALDTDPPAPALNVADVTVEGAAGHSASVTYTDATAVRLSSLGHGDLLVTGPNGYSNLVEFIGADLPSDGSPITALYSIPAPAGSWNEADNGLYTVVLLEDAVEDTLNNSTPQTTLGSFNVSVTAPPDADYELTVTVNNPDWGSVTPTYGTFSAGSSVQLLATPAAYFQFRNWQGDASGTDNPLTLLLDTNRSVLAVFSEIFTTNHPTPHWWLAQNGYTNNFETAVNTTGDNGVPVWQSYVAGLDPNDSKSQFLLAGQSSQDGADYVLNWSTIPDRLYTLWVCTNLAEGFTPVPGAVDLPPTVQSFTNAINSANSMRIYRIEVRIP